MAETAIDKTSVLESLAEARISLAYLRRVALEAGDKALAEKLSGQGAALKARMAVLRRLSHVEWAESARGLGKRFTSARERLGKSVDEIEKDEAAVARVVKAAGVVDDLLSLAGKFLP